jgi:hypothetical protein
VITLLIDQTMGHAQIDFEAIETCLRSSMLEVGRDALERVLNALPHQVSDAPIKCEHGHSMRAAVIRQKRVMTVLGHVDIYRPYYYDASCCHGSSPYDRMLDVDGTMFSPGVRNMMAYVGAKGPFAAGEEDLRRLAVLPIPAKSIERLCGIIGKQVDVYRWQQPPGSDIRQLGQDMRGQTMYIEYDGTGIPVLKRETVGRKGKGPNNEAKTREIKMGCVFTQTRWNADGYPERDEQSTSYVGACEQAETFGRRILHEAQVRGLENAARVCVIGDGAPWIWNLATEHFPRAIQIVDLYHARQHYAEVARMVFSEESARLAQWNQKRKCELDKGDIAAVVRALNRLSPRTRMAREARDKAIGYFQTNAYRMRYKYFRSRGLFVGSGVIEAGCKNVVGHRLKQSGMHWTIQSANDILSLRCLFLGNQWDDFWEARAAA